MEYWKLRIDTDDLEKFTELVQKYSTYWMTCIEKVGTDEVHCHAYLETNQKERTIRNRIRLTYGSGNGVYSMKELDEEKPMAYLAYVVKDKKFKYNVTDELIEAAKLYDDTVKKAMKEKKAKKRTQFQIIEEENQEWFIKTALDVFSMTKRVVKIFKEKGWPVRRHNILVLVETLLIKYTDYYESCLAQCIIDSITPRHQ